MRAHFWLRLVLCGAAEGASGVSVWSEAEESSPNRHRRRKEIMKSGCPSLRSPTTPPDYSGIENNSLRNFKQSRTSLRPLGRRKDWLRRSKARIFNLILEDSMYFLCKSYKEWENVKIFHLVIFREQIFYIFMQNL